MHLPSVIAVASALIALASAGPVNIDSSGHCPILCAAATCCPPQKCTMLGLIYVSISICVLDLTTRLTGVVARLDVYVRRMSAMSTTVSRISTSISIDADDG
ncbi:uncharacterized protein HD556DRAFT_1427642 [Suillus plorans]|uniref:Hydrophobin n=1 Tax=Suillus plorans TaxID=116603 RepID=A0A9P7A987_9AGAM|nr:uncharacterized protein HD556DRAFT_1427642 [Suillus plorans]KAG1784453.1 hypothetical protein HD556DRAFT_1427642 [Suillus plorans]